MNKPRIVGKWFINATWGVEIMWTHNNKRWFYNPNFAIECAIQDQSIVVR